MTISKKQLQEECEKQYRAGYWAGKEAGYNMGVEAGKTLAADKLKAQLEAAKAATELMQEASKMMSRAGYLVGKVNKQEGF